MSNTKLAETIEAGRVVNIGKGQVSYRVLQLNEAGTFAEIVSTDAINKSIRTSIELKRLNINKFAPENQI